MECQEDNLEILLQAFVVDVFHVELDLVGHYLLDISLFRVFRASQNLILVHIRYRGIVGNTGLHAQHLALLFRVQVHIPSHLRPRSYQTHIAFEDIE